ncbi:DDE-type integrase/transposase/recombinase [Aquibacillus halophilus]|uniref:DDE-type integrase/transposase/recombinase n=2 Tax=Aquibacillus halophilus TaxID=930132 RepID=A0A6A8D923_9BACI|nr:DDE-type integrase/transposase/recombinase [Aquibacillus halophilus]
MNSTEFNEWAEKLALSDETKREIEKIRNSPPARRVGGGKKNVSGRFSSKKMGVTIQFESHKVEYPYLHMLEYDENVIEFYDQPPSIKLLSTAKSGKNHGYMYTADYFVIEREKAYWVECKTEEKLIKLSQDNPNRYYFDQNWEYVPLRSYAEEFNLGARVFSSKEINWRLYRNLLFLKDYFNDMNKPDKEVIISIKQKILSSPNITLHDLLESTEVESYTIDDVNALIASQDLYVDLYNSVLSEPKDVKVFLNKEQSKSLSMLDKKSSDSFISKKIDLKAGSKILWGEKIFTIKNIGGDTVFLASHDKTYTELPLNIFENYVREGYIKGRQEKSTVPAVTKKIMKANEDDLKIANKKYDVVKKYLNGEELELIDVTDRTIRNWVKSYKDAELKYGSGYIGLLPKNKEKGNKKHKMPQESIDLMNEFITNSYETIKNKPASIVHGELSNLCEEKTLHVPSYQTFCTAIKKRSNHSLTEKRQGSRAAYVYENFYWELEFTTPKHGDRVFELVHIDHTELDIELDINGKDSKRPWCTFMIDAFSRKILAFYLSFESPSYRSCMMVIRECVKNHSRLPDCIVLDGGKEFNSIYFESLLARYEIHKKERPAAKARFGNVVERLFGIANKTLIHALLGNTQLMKNARQVTKTVNPKNHAIWKFEEFYKMMKHWVNEIYDNKQNPSLAKTPKDAFAQSLLNTGNRPSSLIPYDQNFIIMTLPSPKGKTRKIQIGGIKVDNRLYWSDKFLDPKTEGKVVEVRYDPFNLGIAFVFINKKWEKCTSEYFAQFNGKTEKELQLITEQLKEERRSYSRNIRISTQMVANYIQELEIREKDMEIEKFEQEKEVRKQHLEVVNNNPDIESTTIEEKYVENEIEDEELEYYEDMEELGL